MTCISGGQLPELGPDLSLFVHNSDNVSSEWVEMHMCAKAKWPFPAPKVGLNLPDLGQPLAEVQSSSELCFETFQFFF